MRLRMMGTAAMAWLAIGMGNPHAAQTPAPALLKAARVAMGGEVKLAAVKALLLKGEQRGMSQSVARDGRVTTSYVPEPAEVRALLPDRYLRTIERQVGNQPASQISFGFGGPDLIESGYKRPEALDLYRQAFAELMLLLLLRTDTSMPLMLRDGPMSGTTVEFTGGKDFHGYLDLDPASHLPLRLRYRRPDRTRTLQLTGQMLDVVISADDYRVVDGLRMPCHLAEMVNGELNIETRYASIQINPPLTPADFKK